MVIDVIDGSGLMWIGRRLPRNPKRREKIKSEIEEVNNLILFLKTYGGNPIVVYGMCNALSSVVDQIISRAQVFGNITLLRFHGHGAPGMMAIAGSYGPDMSKHLADFGPRQRTLTRRILSDLKPYFAPYGRVEFHGCEVGKGKMGAQLILPIAKTLGVPVSAAIIGQYDEEGYYVFRFEGPVRTAYPNGKIIITSWRAIPGGYSGV